MTPQSDCSEEAERIERMSWFEGEGEYCDIREEEQQGRRGPWTAVWRRIFPSRRRHFRPPPLPRGTEYCLLGAGAVLY